MQNLMGSETFEKVKSNFLSKILFSADSMSVDNWLLLEKMVASSSSIPYKEEVLRLFTDVSVTQDREEKLKALHEGSSFQYMKDHFFSRLLQKTSSLDSAESLTAQGEGAWRHLRYLVNTSAMDTRGKVLDVIDHNADPMKRVEELIKIDGGLTYRYLCNMYLPALLYNRRSSSLDMCESIKRHVTMTGMPEKREVLNLIDRVPLTPEREAKLKALHSGDTYRRLQDGLFLSLLTGNDSTAVKRLADLHYSAGNGAQQPLGSVQASVSLVELPSRWALKTNFLYDGILMPNLEIEYLISDRLSANLEGQYAWWAKTYSHDYYQIASVSPEIRYWLSRKAPFRGHYVGLYYGGGLYDLEDGNKGYQGECYLSAGLSYGYMKSLSRHLSLELGLGVGYLSTGYKTYLPIDGRYVYQSTQHLNYIGPTKIKISLVWKLSRRVKGIKQTEETK
jgi:hypothetical protein